MLLRVSGEASGEAVDPHAVTDPKAAATSGVADAVVLIAFADALVQGDDAALVDARRGLIEAMGDEGMVDTAAVASNFERMVRIADATGIPVDSPVNAMTEGMRSDHGIDRFGSSANTPPPSAVARVVGRVLAPFTMRLLGPLSRMRARFNG